MTEAADAAPGPTDADDPEVLAAANSVFGARRDLTGRFAALLADAGVTRGLLGPREPARLWARHLLNCAALAPLLPSGARVVDIGSGAGLPGIVLALARPDLRVDLVEPLLRRTVFLDEAIDQLGLRETVRVHRGRADDPAIVRELGRAEWVTARAVAPLGRLVTWCLPLLTVGGTLLAVKGATAAEEVAAHGAQVEAVGGLVRDIVAAPTGLPGVDVHVVVVQRVGIQHRARTTKGS